VEEAVKVVSVVGARPNFVKIAALTRAMRRQPTMVPVLIHTGQHYGDAMSGRFFAELEIAAPDVNLGVGSGTHATQTAEVMRRLEPILESLRPDVVLVVGDVNSTLAAALTAVKLGIPVAHVEAGLRSFDRTMPEEINRLLTDAISDHLFVTEESGRQNLLREGIAPATIHFVGNVMIDALETFKPRWQRSPILDRLGLTADQPYAVLTLHRPANVDAPGILRELLEALQALARHLPIVFPVHPRIEPRLARQGNLSWVRAESGESVPGKGIACLPPLGYLDFIALVSRARLVLTDSGGVQEETTILGVPCLTLRDTTERPVTVTHGTNRVIGTDPTRILHEALRTLDHPLRPASPPPLWDGRAAERIVEILLDRTRAGSVQDRWIRPGATSAGRPS
jgi:UDP-N-acetylglucosamine 2-epimerase (non-hydrolysing)